MLRFLGRQATARSPDQHQEWVTTIACQKQRMLLDVRELKVHAGDSPIVIVLRSSQGRLWAARTRRRFSSAS